MRSRPRTRATSSMRSISRPRSGRCVGATTSSRPSIHSPTSQPRRSRIADASCGSTATPRISAIRAWRRVIVHGRMPAGVGDLPPVEDTRVPAGLVATGGALPARSTARRWVLVLGSLAASVVVFVVISTAIGSSSGSDPTHGDPAVVTRPTLAASGPPAVTDLQVARPQPNVVVWVWKTPRLQTSDEFRVTVFRNDRDQEVPQQRATTFRLDDVPEDVPPCISVVIVRDSNEGNLPKKKCSGIWKVGQ